MTNAAQSTKHPAKFSEPIIDRLRILIQAEKRRVLGRTSDGPIMVLDPFAGIGRIHRFRSPQIRTIGIEIEPEWAACHADTRCGDSLAMMASNAVGDHSLFDIVATSPTYGNRLSDHHDAKDGSTRHSYRHYLDRPLADRSSGALPWGPKYWAFHAEAWRLVLHVLKPGGLFLLNVSDFYKGKALVPAVAWHRGAAMGAGFVHAGRDSRIDTARLRGVGNDTTAARAPHEVILRLRRPEVGGVEA